MLDAAWRLPIFLAVFAAMALAEWYWPRRSQSQQRHRRWLAHAGVQLLNVMVLRVVFPGAAVGIAVLAEKQAWGVLPHFSLPPGLIFVLSLLVLDLAIYVQHRLSHRWHWFWRLHRMHHSDTVVDTTTALRFHPLEILLSMVWKGAVILSLGLSPMVVLFYEAMLNAMALFNHANVKLPQSVDAVLRYLVVTPDAHRVHHSVHQDETDSNFGNTLSLWDRVFGSWKEQPRDGHEAMKIGLSEFRSELDSKLPGLLMQPWK
ncbi:MAG: sterol desaturase family protein [Oceanococcus sp.]